MTRVKLSNDVLIIQVPYHRKDEVSSILGAKWDRRGKVWAAPKESVLDVIERFGTKALDNNANNWAVDYMNLLGQAASYKDFKKQDFKFLDGYLDFLMPHQKTCVAISRMFDRYAFFMDTGTGKTIASLGIMHEKLENGKWLILCPKAIIKTAWLGDQREFFPHVRLLPLSKNMKKGDYRKIADDWGMPYADKEKLTAEADAYIINFESFKSDFAMIKQLPIKGLIIDESARIRNPTTQTTKQVIEYAASMKYVYILSGKPSPNNMFGYFSQMNVVDPSILGNSFFKFRQTFFMPDPTDYMGYRWIPKDSADKVLAKRIKNKAFIVKKADCLDLPDKTYIIRDIALSGKAKSYYNEMYRHRVLIAQDSVVAADNKVTQIMKLRQITAGFILDDVGSSEVLHNQKINELMSVVDDLGDEQAIIWIQFQNEARLIEETLSKQGYSVVTAYGGTKDVDDSIERFKSKEAQFIIAHPRTLMYGVTFTQCTYAIYYSVSYSSEEYYQSHDRIYRKGQVNPCTFIFLLCEKTVDYLAYNAMQDKIDKSDLVEKFIKGVV